MLEEFMTGSEKGKKEPFIKVSLLDIVQTRDLFIHIIRNLF
jgi:hypothetical protein